MNQTQVTRFIDALESEVNNGGFDQFFFNAAGDNTEETIEALEAIGASTTAQVVRQAAQRFPGGMPPKDRYSRQDALEEVSPNAEAFKDLDSEFYGCSEELPSLLERYRQS